MSKKDLVSDESLKKIVCNDLDKLFDEYNLERRKKVSKTKIKDVVSESATKEEVIEESVVATEKQFNFVTEVMSDKTKNVNKTFYQKYIADFNKVSAQLDTVDGMQDENVQTFKSLKEREASLHNAIYLNELYFANSFDTHSEIYQDSLAFLRLSRDFGDFNKWQKDFQSCALATTSGWAVCGYSTFLKKYINVSLDFHNLNIPVGFIPIISLNMWEHSYFCDFLDNKRSYIRSALQELNWAIIEGRVEKVAKIAEVLK